MCDKHETMDFATFHAGESLVAGEKEPSCWSKFKSIFSSDEKEASEIGEDSNGKYERRRTLPFQIGVDGYPFRITYVEEDENCLEKHVESTLEKNGILKCKVWVRTD